MSIFIRRVSSLLAVAAFVVLSMSPNAAVSAGQQAAPSPVVVTPAALVTTQGKSVGTVASLRVMDQSGTVDTPAKYVLFQTPTSAYKGYRTFTVPNTVSIGVVSALSIKANYKGPAKAAQAWTWYLYDWVHLTWVKAGDNAAVTSSTTWKLLQFNATGDVRRFINNSTRQVRLQVVSSNALYDAKLDYESLTLGLGAVCSDPLGCVLVPSGQPIHVSYLLNMPVFESVNGAQLAAEQAATILGHSIQLDGVSRANCDNAASVTDANKMVTDATILAVIGTSCSGEAFQVMPIFSPRGFSMVSPSNTNPGLTDPGTPGYLRVSWNDSTQGELAAEYALHLGATKAATISDGSGYAGEFIPPFVSTFTTGLGTITTQKTISVGQTDMRTELNDIKSGSPQFIYFPISMPEGGYIINQAGVILGPPGTVQLMGSDGLRDPSVVLATGSDLQGFAVTGGPDTTQFTGYAAFVTAYTTRFGSPPPELGFAPYAYDAFNVIKAAIETAAVDLGSGAHLIGRQALRNALNATSAFAGVTGAITCQPGGDCAATPALAVYQYTAGVDNPTKVWP